MAERERTEVPYRCYFSTVSAPASSWSPLLRTPCERLDSSIAFDVPGVGGSATPLTPPYRFSRIARAVEHLLRDIGVSGPVDVLGVSWGGALAQQFVHQYPARCRRLVLAATSAGAVMVPGRPSVLKNMLNPRRYSDKDFMAKVGADL